MTRINVVPPAELCDQHLLAEHRELTRIPNHLAKQGGYIASMGLQMTDYCLGTGHVRFFYNKMAFLRKRHLALMTELKARGFKAESRWPAHMPYYPDFWKDYEPTEYALRINRERIAERLSTMIRKPTWTPHKPNVVFATGSKDPIPGLRKADRRFFVVGEQA